VDIKGGYTYLNTQTGTEVSGAAGFTFSATNTAADYTTGTEFHLEAAVRLLVRCRRLSLPPGHRRQRVGRGARAVHWTRDRGRAGDRLRAEGRRPINLNARWFAEFETENRMKGNAVFASLTVPLRVFAPPTPPKITK
jgi:hypothetical protein